MGARKHDVASLFTVEKVTTELGNGGPRLVVRVRTRAAHMPSGVMRLRACRLDGDGVRCAEAEGDGARRFVAVLPLRDMRGDWEVSIRLGTGDAAWTLPVRSDGTGLPPVRWRRCGVPWYAKEIAADGGRLAVRVAPVDVLGAARKLMRR